MFLFWKEHGIEKRDLLMPASILIGAILISGSIFWNFNKILSFGKVSPTVQDGEQIQGENGEKVSIAQRRDAPSIGSGKVEIVEFSDFQCPFCQQFFNNAYKEIKSKYIDTGKVKFVFRHFPLPFHQNAQKAAEAGECSNKQGKFWQYHDTLFLKGQADGTGLDVPSLKQYAKDLGLDAAKFNVCLDNGETADIVKKDLDEGQKAGVTGTPTIFINGKKIVGAQPFANFEAEIETALK